MYSVTLKFCLKSWVQQIQITLCHTQPTNFLCSLLAAICSKLYTDIDEKSQF